MSRKEQKARRSSALVEIILALLLLALIGSVQAYSTGGPYNLIEKTPEIQNVLRGQDLQFAETASWSAVPVTVYRVAGGSIENTFTADANNRIFDVNWPAVGAYYVNYVNTTSYDAQLSLEDPRIPLTLRVGTVEVTSFAVGTRLVIDTAGINLFPEDRVDLNILDPDNIQISVDVNGQQFTNITVNMLTENYGRAGGLNTAGWKLGAYTFQIETIPEYACGLQLTSDAKAITSGRTSAPIPTATPALTPSPTPTLPPTTPTPIQTLTPTATSPPVTTPTPTPPAPTPTPTPTPVPQEPGFEAVPTLVGFGVLLYLVRRIR
jgi:type II secretory pathway pseudopilin PulG